MPSLARNAILSKMPIADHGFPTPISLNHPNRFGHKHCFDDDEDRARRDCEADDFAVVVQTWTLTGMQDSG